MAEECILAIDQGTTSSRAIVFDRSGRPRASAQREFRQIYPADGWVEHDPEEIWSSSLEVARSALRDAESRGLKVQAIGITNQRETTLVWERESGRAIHDAIVWQDRRTAALCEKLRSPEVEQLVAERSGLRIDPYFSATKIAWILDNVEGARLKAEGGDLAFGTVDSFLLWRLTGGRVHATDVTNASRTGLYNIHDMTWDPELLRLYRVPEALLPRVEDCTADFGMTDPELFGRPIPILGIAGDQQAAAIGQACFQEGSIKSTYGTGCFVILNTGKKPVLSRNRLLTTICYRIGGEATYAIEGSIFISGAAIQWLRDGLGLIKRASDSEALARSLESNGGVYLVPAFTGLGAPHWDSAARGAIFGLTRDSGPAHFARAALEAVCYQTRDLFDAMAEDGVKPRSMRVDGGMVANDWMLQFLADILNIRVDRPEVPETTALGAAYLAGLQAGLFASLDDIAAQWRCQAYFEPQMEERERQRLLAGWDAAVERVRSNSAKAKS